MNRNKKILEFIKKPEGYVPILIAIFSTIIPFFIEFFSDLNKNFKIIQCNHLQKSDTYIFEFINNSKKSINEEDYLEDITIYTNREDATFIQVRVFGEASMQDYLKDKVLVEENKVIIKPTLLNNKDLFFIILTTNVRSDISIQYRIKNVEVKYEPLDSTYNVYLIFMRIVILILIIVIFFMFKNIKIHRNKKLVSMENAEDEEDSEGGADH